MNYIHDQLHSYCLPQWPECPKKNLSRRNTRTGGRTTVEKFVTDITILAKFASSGELSQELADIFQKPRTVENNLAYVSDLASISEGSQGARRELTKNVSLILEEMDLKLCEAKENYLESMADMNNKIDDLKARLTEKDLKTEQLEEELAVVKGRHKTDYQMLWGKYEDYKVELKLLKENQTKAEQKYANLRKDVDRQYEIQVKK